MRKLTLTFILVFVGVCGLWAQAPADTTVKSRFIYCELIGAQKFMSTKIMVAIDFGQETGLFEDLRLRDEQTGKVKTFNSMIDALNYMGEDGWEFVQAYIATSGESNVYHWLLKKRKQGA